MFLGLILSSFGWPFSCEPDIGAAAAELGTTRAGLSDLVDQAASFKYETRLMVS